MLKTVDLSANKHCTKHDDFESEGRFTERKLSRRQANEMVRFAFQPKRSTLNYVSNDNSPDVLIRSN